MAEVIENKHFDQSLETRVVCDASTFDLGAALEQLLSEGWFPILRRKIFNLYVENITGSLGRKAF